MMELKINIIYGSVTPIISYRIEGDKLVAYSHAIHKDDRGVVTRVTEPSILSWMEFK